MNYPLPDMRYHGIVKPVLVAFAVSIAIGALGTSMTDIGPWYQSLAKPSWQPPDWLFGPAWTIIFSLAALSAAFAWRAAPTRNIRDTIIILFLANGTLNVLWSILFFRLKRPDWALIEVGFLLAAVIIPMIYVSRYSRTAGVLLLPYAAWVSFAAFLNYRIVQLNPIT